MAVPAPREVISLPSMTTAEESENGGNCVTTDGCAVKRLPVSRPASLRSTGAAQMAAIHRLAFE